MKYYSIAKQNSVDFFRQKIVKHDIQTVSLGLVDLYGRFMGKKMDSDYFTAKVLEGSVFACDYLLSSDIKAVPLSRAKLASFEKGYGDFVIKPRISSGREVTYVNANHELVFFGDVLTKEGEFVGHSPYNILLESLEKARKIDLEAVVEVDMEGIVVEKNYRKLHQSDLKSLSFLTKQANTHSSFYTSTFDYYFTEIEEQSKKSKIPLYCLETRESQGQIGFKLDYQCPLKAAEDITLLKLVLV